MTKQIPQGYKQTKVGIIPEDWDVVKFSALINDFRGGAPLKPSDFTNAGIKVLSKGGIVPGGVLRISRHNQQYCSIDYYEKYKNNSIDNTYVIVVLRDLVPSGPSIGLMVKYYSSEKYLLAQGVYGIRYDLAKICENYMIQLSNSDWYRKLMNEIMVGSTQVHITNTEFLKQVMPLPQLKEQEKIAEILSTWDDAITKQEQLIEQKQVFKKGIMQQIFTQKIRFKDDNGKDYPAWKEHKLTKIAKTSIGLVTTMTTSYVENNGTPLIRNSDILPNNIKDNLIQLSNQFANQYNNRKLKYLDIVMVHTGDVGVSAVINKALDGCHGFATLNTRVNQEILNPFFLSFYFNSSSYISYAIKMSTGDGRCNFNLKDFDNSIIPTPVLDEQTKISDFLTQIDDEMTKQTEILDQLKLQKQSLMQKLLTGQVRVFTYSKEMA